MDFVFKRTYHGPLKCAICDWVGTTMDYRVYAPAVVFIEVYGRQGVEISVAEARGPMGAHKTDYSKLIPGALEVLADFKKRGMVTGSTTRYTRAMVDINLREAQKQGYYPDNTVGPDEV